MLVVLLVAAVAALTSAEDIDIVSSPSPGHEYTHLHRGESGHHSLNVSHIEIKDEGLSGLQRSKPYPLKKADATQGKKDTSSVALKPTIKDEGASGVLAKKTSSNNGVPPQKHLTSYDTAKYEVISHKDRKLSAGDTGGLDFDDDEAPLGNRKLKPAGTSQASRINVKKGPNGQDYEYEYVYYYYDDEEEEGGATKTATPTTTQPPSRGRYHEIDRGTQQQQSRHTQEEPRDEELQPSRGRVQEDRNKNNNNRYTTIERGRSTTAEPSVNEVVPSRGGSGGRGENQSRGRGRPSVATNTEPVPEEERLPSNTRFPSRGRGQSGTTAATTLPPQPLSRTRGTVRRPSLVDSSSFRTHSSDVAPDTDQGKYYSENTRESDLEEYVEDVKATTYMPQPLITTQSIPEAVPDQMPEKAALDLYAILQQTQEENSVSGADIDPEPETTEPVIITTTTTTTTTTPAPTTTTTTTTTAAPLPVGRNRFRSPGGTRTRLRPGGASTSTEAAPSRKEEEEEAPRRKFQPNSSSRAQTGGSSYSRRGQRTSTTSSPSQEESTTARTRAHFGQNHSGGNRYKARGRQTTAAPSEEEPEATSASTPSSRPTRPRLNVSAATRPLRPGPRINLRGRAGPSTSTAAPLDDEHSEASTAPAPSVPQPLAPSAAPEEEPSSSAAPLDALSRLRNRPRLKVTPRSHISGPAPVRPPPQGFKRPGRIHHDDQASTEAPAAAPTEPPAPVEASPTEPPAAVQQQAPHLARRRPSIRRLSLPSSQQQQ